MLRKSFRIGLKVGILVGIAVAVGKMLQARSESGRAGAPPPAWRPLPDGGPPVETPAKVTAPSAPPAAERSAARPPAAKKASKKAAKKKEKVERATTWVEPDADGVCPTSHPVKAKLSSKIFHLPGMLNYDRTKPDRCYVDGDAAEQDGLRAAKR